MSYTVTISRNVPPHLAPINQLLDEIMSQQNLKNDAALARASKFAPPLISKLRSGATAFTASHLIVFHKLTGWPVEEIESVLGIDIQGDNLSGHAADVREILVAAGAKAGRARREPKQA